MKPVVYAVFSITIYFYDRREELLFFALLNSSMCAAMPWQRSGSQTKGCGRKDDRTEEKLRERTQRETETETELLIRRDQDHTVGFVPLSDGSNWEEME